MEEFLVGYHVVLSEKLQIGPANRPVIARTYPKLSLPVRNIIG